MMIVTLFPSKGDLAALVNQSKNTEKKNNLVWLDPICSNLAGFEISIGFMYM